MYFLFRNFLEGKHKLINVNLFFFYYEFVLIKPSKIVHVNKISNGKKRTTWNKIKFFRIALGVLINILVPLKS